ncbi:hypothetical protein [Streptomyces hydrogenans]|uniref:hypothetical protein n=1 Tax=Streptomyces hydrogenans TaxID=1873719 RepID=UPI0035D744AE
MSGYTISRIVEDGRVVLDLEGVAFLELEGGSGYGADTVKLEFAESDFNALAAGMASALPRRAAHLHSMIREFEEVQRALAGPIDFAPTSQVTSWLMRLERVATDAVYAENAEGGKAREEAAKLRKELEELEASHAALIELGIRFEKERDEARDQRDAWKEAVEALDAKHVRPLRQELAALKEQHEECRAQRRAARAAAPRFMWTSTSEEHLHAAEELERLVWWAHPTQGVPPAESSDVDELRAVIVSQAREIARLKGESE